MKDPRLVPVEIAIALLQEVPEKLLRGIDVKAIKSEARMLVYSFMSLEELADQALILREKGSGTRQSVERLLRERGESLSWSNVVLTLGSTQGVVKAVRDGLGIGFVSVYAAASESLPVVRIQGLDLTRELYMAYEPGRATSGLLRAFLAFARAWGPKMGSP